MDAWLPVAASLLLGSTSASRERKKLPESRCSPSPPSFHQRSTMLSCGACRERCLQTVVGQSIFPTPLCAWKGPVSVHDSFSRSYHNSKQRKSRRPEHLSPNYRKKTAWLQPKNKYGTSTEHDKTPRILATGGVPLRRKDYKMEQSMAAVLQRHQTYANDPLKLAEFVRKSLRGDDWDTAVSLVRAASKHIQCTVSWNHLIDWELSKGKMNAALKTYNEVCFILTLIRSPVLTFWIDEEARTNSGLSYFHNYHQRLYRT